MKKENALHLIATLLMIACLAVAITVRNIRKQSVEPPAAVTEHVEESDTWPLFIEALIWVESRGNEKIVGANNDGGVLQITPIYIAEANGIIGQRAYYKLDDRFNREKSIEMFNVVNAYHNPDRDFRKATRLHNPGADSTYHAAVMNRFTELLKRKHD